MKIHSLITSVGNTVRSSHAKVQHGRNNILNKLKQDIATAMVDKKSKDTATTSPIDGPTMTLRSGRVIGKWHIAQVRIRHNKSIVGDNIKFKFTDPPDPRFKPISDVFNIPELLEQILLNLETSFLIKKAMLVCRGFKQSLDGSPTFRKRSCFVFRINNNFDEAKAAGGIPRFYVNLRPKWMPRLCETPMQKALHFSFEGSFPWFKFLATMEGLKRLRVFEDMPAIVMVNWNTNGRREVIGRIWLRKNVSGLTFGHVFDSMARSIPDEENVESVEIKWV